MKDTIYKKIVRFAIGLAIALAAATFVAVLAWYSVANDKTIWPAVRWLGLLGNTAIVFWLPIQEHKRYWSRIAFWFTSAGLLTIHILGFMALLRAYPEWRLTWFVPTDLIEVCAIYLILYASMSNHQSANG